MKDITIETAEREALFNYFLNRDKTTTAFLEYNNWEDSQCIPNCYEDEDCQCSLEGGFSYHYVDPFFLAIQKYYGHAHLIADRSMSTCGLEHIAEIIAVFELFKLVYPHADHYLTIYIHESSFEKYQNLLPRNYNGATDYLRKANDELYLKYFTLFNKPRRQRPQNKFVKKA